MATNSSPATHRRLGVSHVRGIGAFGTKGCRSIISYDNGRPHQIQAGPRVTTAMRCWLVERDYDDKGLVRLVYATPGGDRRLVQERSAAMLGRVDVTAAVDVDADRLVPVDDPDTRDRYSAEVDRMQTRHEPDEPV